MFVNSCPGLRKAKLFLRTGSPAQALQTESSFRFCSVSGALDGDPGVGLAFSVWPFSDGLQAIIALRPELGTNRKEERD